MNKIIITLYLIFVVLNSLDYGTTTIGLRQEGIAEGNPMMLDVVKNNHTFLAIKILATVTVAPLIMVIATKLPIYCTILMIFINVVYTAIVINNLTVIF